MGSAWPDCRRALLCRWPDRLRDMILSHAHERSHAVGITAGCRIVDHQAEFGTPIDGEGREFKLQQANIRVVKALEAFMMCGDFVVAP